MSAPRSITARRSAPATAGTGRGGFPPSRLLPTIPLFISRDGARAGKTGVLRASGCGERSADEPRLSTQSASCIIGLLRGPSSPCAQVSSDDSWLALSSGAAAEEFEGRGSQPGDIGPIVGETDNPSEGAAAVSARGASARPGGAKRSGPRRETSVTLDDSDTAAAIMIERSSRSSAWTGLRRSAIRAWRGRAICSKRSLPSGPHTAGAPPSTRLLDWSFAARTQSSTCPKILFSILTLKYEQHGFNKGIHMFRQNKWMIRWKSSS